MSADGQLNVSFMGTQQVQYGFLQAPQRPFNYEQGIKEIETLTQSLHSGNLKSGILDLNKRGLISVFYILHFYPNKIQSF